MRTFFLIGSVFVLIFALLAGAFVVRSRTVLKGSNAKDESFFVSDTAKKKKVVTTIYPLGAFARNVGGDRTDVTVIVPSGVEPHEYEPTSQDIASMYTSDIVIMNGAGMDSWALKIRSDLEFKGVKVIVMSRVLGFEDNDFFESDGRLSEIDPHFWLDPILAEKQVHEIRNVLEKIDEDHAEEYKTNTRISVEKLQALDRSYRDGLDSCKQKTIITSHNAVGYAAKRYGFEALSVSGFSSESEPSTRQLADLASLSKQKNIRFVFFETLTSSKVADVLAQEIGARTLVFNPVEGLTDEEIHFGKEYFSIMYENLHNLQTAMECYE